MLYEFQLGNNASAPPHSICAAFDESTVADRACRQWFKRFQEGDMSLEDYPRSGRPLSCDVERLQALVEDNPQLTNRQLSIMLNCNYSIIDWQLHQLGKVNKTYTMGSTATDAREHPTEDHHLRLFVAETQSIQVSPANRYW